MESTSVKVNKKEEPILKASKANNVKVVNINMPFWDIVFFMVKVAFASIPATICFTILLYFMIAMIGGLLGVNL